MEYQEEDYLMLSGIQHFAFCRRQWALIHIERQWEENVLTFEGRVMHDKAHDPDFREKRKGLIIVRAMRVFSRTMGISGECDVVEFHQAEKGVTLQGTDGLYSVVPIEYKRGSPKLHDADELQLTAQAMCLEEMLMAQIEKGFLYYGETRHRTEVLFSPEMREKVKKFFEEMHLYYDRGYTPKVRIKPSCKQCSLYNLCVPQICEEISAEKYVKEMIEEDIP